MTTKQLSTYHVVLAPVSTSDPEFTEQFGLHKVNVLASNRDDAIMKAAITSGIAQYECGDFTVRSVEVVPEPKPETAVCEFVHGDLTMIECARNGCNLCAGELDIAGEDF